MAKKEKGAPAFFDVDQYASAGAETQEAADQQTSKAAIFKSTAPIVGECRSVRAELLCRPSTIEKIKKYLQQEKNAGRRKGTFNDLVNELLDKFVEEKGLY